MSADSVPTGPYYGYTYDQLVTERAALVARRQRVSSLIGSSINGDSFQREGSQTELKTLDQQIADLQDAFVLIQYASSCPSFPTNSVAIRFRNC